MALQSRELPMTRNLRRSLVCSSLAFALCFTPSLPLLAATVVVTAPDGVPGPDGDPEALSAEAVEHFQAKEYDAAVDLFEQAYAIDPQPNYLFNIGRVYEEKGDLENAVVYYQRFVGQSGVDLEARQSATERLKVLREALAQMKADEDAKDPGDDKDPPPDEIVPPDKIEDGDADEQAEKRKKILRITGYSLLGAGGGLVIVGAIFGGIASGTVDDADADPFVDRKAALRDRARRQARTADALFITGGVVATAGLVLVLSTLGRKKAGGESDQVSRRTMWAPVVGPTQVGLGLTHRF